MSEQRYEYVVVELTGNKWERDRAYTDQINKVAAHGWRLVTVSADGPGYGAFATFEREVQQ